MSSTPFIFRILNPMMKALLRSPLHGLVSDRLMIISFTGTKTGQSYSTPVSYRLDDGTVYCFTHGRWWTNLKGGAPVRLRLQGQELSGRAEPVPDDLERRVEGLRKMLMVLPGDARFYNVTIGPDGQPDEDDLLRAAREATMIVVRLDESYLLKPATQ